MPYAGQVVCPSCAIDLRRRKGNRSTILAIGAVAGGFGAATLLVAFFLAHHSSFEYGRFAPVIDKARARLAENPCDHSSAIQLADALSAAGDSAETLRFSHDFFARCGDEPRILWATFGAHKQRGDWDGAIEDATKLIDSDPEDKDYGWWRATVWERKGNFEKAAADYEKSIELEPRVTNIPINLATLYEKMKRPCDAARTLRNYLEKHPDTATTLAPRAATLETVCRGNVPRPASAHDAPVSL